MRDETNVSNQPLPEASPPSRRDFARQLFGAAVAALTLGRRARAQQRPSRPENSSAPPEPLSPEMEAKFEAIVSRYGSRLSDEQKRMIREELRQMQHGLEELRRFPLENADDPAEVFAPWRKR